MKNWEFFQSYRAGPHLIAIKFMTGTKILYARNDSHDSDLR